MNKDKPILYFTVGLPGSSKSTWAEANKEKLNMVIHSSDAIRKELGDVNDQSKNDLVFSTLYKRVKEDLIAGKNVCMDQTGLKRKNRLHFLRQIQNIPCEKICVLFATPIISCRKNNRSRERKVPEEVITRMYKSFEVPCKQEGYDDIQIVWWDYKKDGLEFNFEKDLKKWRNVEHNNPNHANSIGDHMIKAYEYMCKKTDDIYMQMAAIMHDCGKPITKGYYDSKGNPSKIAHFYNHNNVGSYLSLFYLKEMGYSDEDILYISLLIELHMRPFLAWNQSEKAKEKDRILFGDDIIADVEVIHQCDRAAH